MLLLGNTPQKVSPEEYPTRQDQQPEVKQWVARRVAQRSPAVAVVDLVLPHAALLVLIPLHLVAELPLPVDQADGALQLVGTAPQGLGPLAAIQHQHAFGGGAHRGVGTLEHMAEGIARRAARDVRLGALEAAQHFVGGSSADQPEHTDPESCRHRELSSAAHGFRTHTTQARFRAQDKCESRLQLLFGFYFQRK